MTKQNKFMFDVSIVYRIEFKIVVEMNVFKQKCLVNMKCIAFLQQKQTKNVLNSNRILC